jgi:hypothetical protein
VLRVAHEIRVATHSLLHRGTTEQLAEGQRLLEETRRALYLILANEPAVESGEAAEAADTAASVDTTASTVPPEVDENPAT